MRKVVRDGKVAVLVSPGFGAGWYSWNQDYKELLFLPEIVELVENNKNKEINEDLLDRLGFQNIYCGGAEDLIIKWVEEGQAFRIDEYDGAEGLIYLDLGEYTIA